MLVLLVFKEIVVLGWIVLSLWWLIVLDLCKGLCLILYLMWNGDEFEEMLVLVLEGVLSCIYYWD